MKIIRHRCNTLETLKETPVEYGVEIDIRSRGDVLILAHDPYTELFISFDAWLEAYSHSFLILNVKEEGLEEKIEALLKNKGINNFFFLDQSFPFLIKTAKRGELRVAIRVSEYESPATAIEFARSFPVKGDTWIWIDCFRQFWLNEPLLFEFKEQGFQLCLVSPELQGRTEAEIQGVRKILNGWQISLDAVCTKKPYLWL